MVKNDIKITRKLHSKLNNNSVRKKSSVRWLSRQLNDPYVSMSKDDGYRSRAAYKLIEINNKFNLLKRGINVLDLGSSPGSWTQVILQNTYTKKQKIVAVDILEQDPLPYVKQVQCDIYDDTVIDTIKNHAVEFNLITCDIAPNTTGHSNTDHYKIIDLAERVVEIAEQLLAMNGDFIIKIFQGSLEISFFTMLNNKFDRVKRFKPKSSRHESKEIYLIAMGFKRTDG